MIEAIAAAGITGGCNAAAKLYCPNAPVTRGQMATFLDPRPRPAAVHTGLFHRRQRHHPRGLRSTGSPRQASPPEPDPATFNPSGTVTRAQMATFLGRALQLTQVASGPFTDLGGTTPRRLHQRHRPGRHHDRLQPRGHALLPLRSGHTGADGHLPRPSVRSHAHHPATAHRPPRPRQRRPRRRPAVHHRTPVTRRTAATSAPGRTLRTGSTRTTRTTETWRTLTPTATRSPARACRAPPDQAASHRRSELH